VDIINPVTIVLAILGGCVRVISYYRHKKKEDREHRIMQGIIQE